MTAEFDWLKKQAEDLPDKTAVSSYTLSYNYKSLDAAADNFATILNSCGVGDNQYVPVILGHSVDFLISILALWKTGAIPVPLSPQSSRQELDNIIKEVNSDICISDDPVLYPDHNLNIIKPVYTTVPGERIKFKQDIDSNKEAVVIFTSGSSGKPKGAVHTFSSLFNSFNSINKFDNYNAEDVFLASLPFHHIGGFAIIVRSLLCGGHLTIPEGTDYKSIADAMRKFDPTRISLVPTNLKRLINNGIKPNNSLKSVYLGGGPSSNELVAEAVDKHYPIIKVYGSTETGSMVAAVKIMNESEFGSSGRPINGNSIIIEPTERSGSTKNPNEGEILVSSKALFSGYFNQDSSQSFNDKGYYRTGDYGFIDASGHLHVLMRRNDLIISGGENINPVEVEDAFKTIAGISDCCVIGLKDNEWGQKVVAFYSGDLIDKELIRTGLKKKLTPYKIPKEFIRVERIPRNELGKVNKRELIKFIDHD